MIGKLDQRITLRAYTATSDGAGGQTHTWANFGTTPTVWARVEPQGGSEAMAEGRVTATAMYRFTIRYRGDVSESDGILWGGEHYNIRQVMREGSRAMYLVIMAERGAPR